MNNNNDCLKQRIEFIDSLRGFLILSVVMCYLSGYCMGIGEDIPSFEHILLEFRNPPFFLLSGFFAYKIGAEWNGNYTFNIVKKKFRTILWPTCLFLLIILYVHPSINGRTFLRDNIKDVWFYWFTYALFLFFFFYAVIEFILHILRCNETIKDLALMTIALLCYLLFSVQSIYDKPLMSHQYNLFRIVTYLMGIVLTFYFFLHYSLPIIINKFFTTIGKRTLDIYLIHYFLLPLGLYAHTSFLRESPMPIVELAISIAIAVIIIVSSLLVSTILRMSPIATNFIFGENTHKKTETI